MAAGELIHEIQRVYAVLEALEADTGAAGGLAEKNAAPGNPAGAKAAAKDT